MHPAAIVSDAVRSILEKEHSHEKYLTSDPQRLATFRCGRYSRGLQRINAVTKSRWAGAPAYRKAQDRLKLPDRYRSIHFSGQGGPVGATGTKVSVWRAPPRSGSTRLAQRFKTPETVGCDSRGPLFYPRCFTPERVTSEVERRQVVQVVVPFGRRHCLLPSETKHAFCVLVKENSHENNRTSALPSRLLRSRYHRCRL
jgi:hypothetical protein